MKLRIFAVLYIFLGGLCLLDGWMLPDRQIQTYQIWYWTAGLVWLVLAAVILALLCKTRKPNR